MTATANRRAYLYSNPKGAMAYAERRTASGLFLAGPPFIKIVGETAPQVAAAVRSVLAASATIIPDPPREEFAAIAEPRLAAAGARTESAFMKEARLVQIGLEKDVVRIIPHHNGGATGRNKGFQSLRHKAIALPADVDDASLGSACLQALALCE